MTGTGRRQSTRGGVGGRTALVLVPVLGLGLGAGGCCFAPTPTPTPPPTAVPVAPSARPSSVASPTPMEPAAPTPAPTSRSETTPAEELAARRAHRIERPCLRLYAGQVRAAFAAYLDRMGDRDAPAHPDWTNPSSLNYLHFSSVPMCRRALDEALALEPAVANWNAAARPYGDALEHLVRLGEETKTYYERESWRDDGGARGQELHVDLREAFVTFFDADRALRRETWALERAEVDAELGRLTERVDAREAFLVARTRSCAMRSVEEVTLSDLVPSGRGARIDPADPAGVWARIQECEAIVDAMRAAPEAATIDASFQRDAAELIAALLRTGRAIRDGDTLRSEAAARAMLDEVAREHVELEEDFERR